MRHISAGAIMRGWTADDDAIFNESLERLFGHTRFSGYSHSAIAWIIHDDLPDGRGDGIHVLAREISIETLEYRLSHPERVRKGGLQTRTRPFSLGCRRAEEWAVLARVLEHRMKTRALASVPVDSIRQAVIDDWADAVHGWDINKIARKITVETVHWRLMFPLGPPRPHHFTAGS